MIAVIILAIFCVAVPVLVLWTASVDRRRA